MNTRIKKLQFQQTVSLYRLTQSHLEGVCQNNTWCQQQNKITGECSTDIYFCLQRHTKNGEIRPVAPGLLMFTMPETPSVEP